MAGVTRRTFIAGAGAVPVLTGVDHAVARSRGPRTASVVLARVDDLPTDVTRTWIGPQYWSNRLADWRLTAGRIESTTAVHGGQTVGVLNRRIPTGDLSGSISVRTGTLATGTGFSGFLIGTGGGALDWRAAALVMAASGQGGGMLATYESDGHVRFRDHTPETNQFAYPEIAANTRTDPGPARTIAEDVLLQLDITATGNGQFALQLSARRFSDGTLLSQATRSGVPDTELVGGISLMSTAYAGDLSARYWFRDLQTGGAKIVAETNTAGPVLGTLYSVNGSVLKLSAQFMPIGATDPQQATLQKRSPGTGVWTTVATVPIGVGYVALFRVEGWQSNQPWEFQITWADGTPQQAAYSGVIRQDPRTQADIVVASMCCTIHSYRNLDSRSSGAPRLPGEQFLGLYTSANLYFPNAELATNIARHRPDLLVALGDQFYETRPTAVDRSPGPLDALFRWNLWLWSFGELTRQIPTICLVDDHDMFHPNLWGWSGRPAPRGNYRYGGYLMAPQWVNAVQRMQCSHDPDAFDPTPVLQGISVYYAAFSYGGVSFALLEDRKFKNTNQFGKDPSGRPLPAPRQLLGARQERFLAAWAKMHPGQPKVCLTQTPYACIQTDPAGLPTADPDSNGSPVPARRRALKLLRSAHALILSGDQHLGTLVRQGIDTHTDGPMDFTPPAGGTSWQRWFEPATRLPNARGRNTGDFTDGFGNKFRVLATVNPKISHAEVHRIQPGANDVGDRNLKREGYGIVHINKTAKSFRLECWPWDIDPTAPGAAQYAGWPVTVSFGGAGGIPTA
jgi:alkaline phosphatase D